MQKSEIKILIIGILFGIIGTLLILKLMSTSRIAEEREFLIDNQEYQLDLEEDIATDSSTSGDMEQF